MNTTKRGAGDGGQTSATEMDVPNRLAWIVSAFNDEDHPSNREEADLELSRALWGDYFQTGRDRLDEWDAPYADPGPAADFSIYITAPADAGADLFF